MRLVYKQIKYFSRISGKLHDTDKSFLRVTFLFEKIKKINENMPHTFQAVFLNFFKDTAWSDTRRCDYTGLYYCSICHWGSSAVIPARVVHNWDLEAYPVCQASLQLLRITSSRPFINLEKINPKLFNFVHELNLVRRLRSELIGEPLTSIFAQTS